MRAGTRHQDSGRLAKKVTAVAAFLQLLDSLGSSLQYGKTCFAMSIPIVVICIWSSPAFYVEKLSIGASDGKWEETMSSGYDR